MKSTKTLFPRFVVSLGRLALVVLLAVAARPVSAQNAAASPNAEADKAWRETSRAMQQPFPPADWQTNKPSPEQVAEYYRAASIKGADAAHDFYTKYPNHPKVAEAKSKEFNLLNMAAERFGDTSHAERVVLLEKQRLDDPKLSADDRWTIRFSAVRKMMAKLPEGTDEFIKQVQALQKDFPKKEEPYQLLLMAASQTDGPQAKEIAMVIIDGDAPEQMKTQAKGILKRMDALGKPISIQYTATDGRKVDLAALKGKVVLIDFWATWCGPCVAEIPNVKAAYDKLHDKGFEIVGISFDREKDALEKFVAKEKMAWPQYFEDKGQGNKFGDEFGVNAIPTMWLVDREGNLADMSPRGRLEDAVTKLLDKK